MKYFSMIDRQAEIRRGKSKVIPSQTFQDLLDSKQLLEEAQKSAEKHKKATKTICQRLREEAKQKGFEEGLYQFNQQIISLDSKFKKLQSELQKSVLSISIKTIKKVIGKELSTNPEIIVDIVRQVIRPVVQSKEIKILLTKKDKEILENNDSKIRELCHQLQVLEISEDPNLTEGDCTIITEFGIICAKLDDQWKALEAAFEAFNKGKK